MEEKHHLCRGISRIDHWLLPKETKSLFPERYVTLFILTY